MTTFKLGDRVRVAVDKVNQMHPRVPPMTGHRGVVREVKHGALIDRVRVELDAYRRDGWFHEDELALEEES